MSHRDLVSLERRKAAEDEAEARRLDRAGHPAEAERRRAQARMRREEARRQECEANWKPDPRKAAP